MRRPRLLAVSPADSKSREYRLRAREVTVGNADGNDLVLCDTTVSRRHALIRYTRGLYEVTALPSTNGTLLNGKRISKPTVLADGDELRFGSARYMFVDPRRRGRARAARMRRIRRVSTRTVLEALALLFVIGFIVAEYLLNRDAIDRMVRGTAAQPSPEAMATAGPLATPATTSTPAPSVALAAPAASAASAAPRPVAAVAPAITAPPAPPAPAKPSAPEPKWLARVNYYRRMGGVQPVVEDDTLSDGDRKHARYLIENYGDIIKNGGDPGGAAHNEEEGRDWFTAEGFAAAKNSVVYEGCSATSPAQEIDGWVNTPFHRLPIINPNLKRAGYGRYDKGDCWAAALDTHFVDSDKPFDRPRMFPPDRATIGMASFDGNEWPPPLTSCPGYVAPVGLPVTVVLGSGIDAILTAHSVTKDGQPVEHCAFDASSYANPSEWLQDRARKTIKADGAIVLIPRRPLTPNATYNVEITANGQSYKWSFKVAAK
jgi:uncharacterized protein YkwD